MRFPPSFKLQLKPGGGLRAAMNHAITHHDPAASDGMVAMPLVCSPALHPGRCHALIFKNTLIVLSLRRNHLLAPPHWLLNGFKSVTMGLRVLS
eukprot:1687684-Amphidinium_carterae.1